MTDAIMPSWNNSGTNSQYTRQTKQADETKSRRPAHRKSEKAGKTKPYQDETKRHRTDFFSIPRRNETAQNIPFSIPRRNETEQNKK